MLTCLIIEDQPAAQRLLARYVTRTPELTLVGTFGDAVGALAYLRAHPVDVLLLDIQLPQLSGLELLRVLPSQPQVILTTAYAAYALEGYEYSVTDYLLKPISFERFVKAVAKLTPAAPTTEPIDHVFVRDERSLLKLVFRELVYIKAEDDYTRVQTTGRAHLLAYPLKYWVETLPAAEFCQIHRSYVVRLGAVGRVVRNAVHLTARAESLPVGRSYREGFLGRLHLLDS